jgi:hypothetical protein
MWEGLQVRKLPLTVVTANVIMSLTSSTDPSPQHGSRKAAISLLALIHQGRRAHSPTSTESILHSTVAHDPPLGQPFEKVTKTHELPSLFEEVIKTHELPSLHQLTSLFDAVACTTNTHPDPSRVPPLVTAAMSLLSRAPAWPKQSLGRFGPAALRSSRGAAQYADMLPWALCRCAAWLDHGRSLRQQLAPPAALGHQPRLQIHGRRPPLLRAAPQDVLQQWPSRPLALPELTPWCASSGRAWQLWAARHTNTVISWWQRPLKMAQSVVASPTAFGHPGCQLAAHVPASRRSRRRPSSQGAMVEREVARSTGAAATPMGGCSAA